MARTTPSQRRGPDGGGDEGWRVRLELEQTHRARDAGAAKPVAAKLLEHDLGIARCANALGEDAVVGDALRAAARSGALALIAEHFAEGSAAIEDAGPREIVALGSNRLSPPTWLGALWAACLCRDQGALRVLARERWLQTIVERARVRHDAIGHEPVWGLIGKLVIATLADTRRDELVEQAKRAVSTYIGAAIEFRWRYGPVARLIAALPEDDAAVWHERAATALERWNGFFTDPEYSNLDGAMLPLEIAALCALAVDRRGAAFAVDSDFFPELVRSRPAAFATRFRVEPSERTVRSEPDAHWTLDLELVPRAGREVRRDGSKLVIASHDDTLDVVAPFAIDAAKPAFDPGEILLVADVLEDAGERAAAGEALDAILAMFARGSPRLFDRAFHTDRGCAVRKARPGDLSRERLVARRDRLIRPAPRSR